MADKYIEDYIADTASVLWLLDKAAIEKAVQVLKKVKKAKGRIFFLGAGGGAANASHAANDFRKIGGIEAYAATDNVAELTARINDEGWETVFTQWLKASRLCGKDCVFVFSVGGGSKEKKISANIVFALEYARKVKAVVIGIVGRDGGHTARVADAAIIVPTVNKDAVTSLTESFQPLIWHLLVTHPSIKSHEMKWESVRSR
ncbi:MAG: SIS domain-containing protein [Candidatus Omnitrophota bacterium]|jgi:D-sedoheptulose 7-phosphate isomerase